MEMNEAPEELFLVHYNDDDDDDDGGGFSTQKRYIVEKEEKKPVHVLSVFVSHDCFLTHTIHFYTYSHIPLYCHMHIPSYPTI